MKSYIILLGLIGCALLSATAHSAVAVSETDALKMQLDKVQDLQLQHALIKTEADLAFYQSISHPEFPLNAFKNPHIRQDFLGSIKFSDQGMIHFNSDALSVLSYPEVYKILALFGQSYLAELVVPIATEKNSIKVKKPYLSNAEYPLLAELRGIDISDASESVRVAEFQSFYAQTLVPGLLTNPCVTRPHHDVIALLEMLYTINFYSTDAEVANRHLDCFEGYVKQFPESKYKTVLAKEVYKSLLSSRLIKAANQLQQQYPDMQVGKLPKINGVVVDGPSVYRINAATKTLTQQAFTFKTGTEVIVIGHPYCHFCQYLIKDIVADDTLTAFFTQHARWLADESYLDHIDAIEKWNQDHPMAHLDIAYLKQDFNQLDNWGTPAIYFLKDGKVMDKLIGWSRKGQKDQLMTHIANYFPDFK